MQIVIPMSGYGERFRAAGYSVPKPLIWVEGKPIIAHVIEMFPGETDFVFVCNQDHIDNNEYNLEETLNELCPTGKVVGIRSHKLGPIHAVQQVQHLLKEDQPVVVNYCDFTCYWCWSDFKKFVEETESDGAIPAYQGFHPHSLGDTNYAYMREEDGWAIDIQEKKPFTSDRMSEFASSGTYYFKSARLMNECFNYVLNESLDIGGEYYCSLAYKYMFRNNMSVSVYPLQHFMQWGTPDDLHEYNIWSTTFRNLIDRRGRLGQKSGAVIVPMAGLGKRFVDEGYLEPKPLVKVSGAPMAVQAARDLPLAENYVFVLRENMLGIDIISKKLEESFSGVHISWIDSLSEGQACTAAIGLNSLECKIENFDGPVTFGACDNGVIFNENAFAKQLADPSIDVLVWGVRGYPNAIRRPEMFGWIEEVDGQISSISVKKPLCSPKSDPIVIGAFTFKRVRDFNRAYESLVSRDGRINGEFFIDSLINDAIGMGLKCSLFEVDSYLCWGTPNDLKSFQYWQSCFDKWRGHPYELEKDSRINRDEIGTLKVAYRRKTPSRPKKRNR